MVPIFFNSRRSAVHARGGMVASSQPLAVAAGLEILHSGGNAADAAVAVAAALNVTEPTSTGLGGDCFSLYFDGKNQKISALNGSGRAPAGLTIEKLQNEGFGNVLPPYHPYTITVPGACAGWCDLVERFGTLQLKDILAPAIQLAEEGFPVAPLTAWYWQRGAEKQLAQALNGQELTIEGRGPRAGEIFRNPGLARTLRMIGEGGKDAFYQGDIGKAIADVVQQAGGSLQINDLMEHHSTWEDPIGVEFQGLRIWECPPNGQGLVALLAVNILRGFDLSNMSPFSVERLHLMIDSLKLAFADARLHGADPFFYRVPLEELLSEGYAEKQRARIDLKTSLSNVKPGIPRTGSDTVYFCVVDKEGNACSFINSNYMGFGTGIVPKGWGFSLQNRGHNFSLDPLHPNVLEPGKRPYHTIIPGMLTRTDGSLYGPMGVMGGFMQPQGHVQVLLGLALDGLDPQEALDRPRFCIDAESEDATVSMEEGMPQQTADGLQAMGHSLKWVKGYDRALFGRGQIIIRNAETGILCGGSDPRADGCAMGLL